MSDDLDNQEQLMKVRRRIQTLDRQSGKIERERTDLLFRRAELEGFRPCDDCFNGWCSMNCSSAPHYIKVFM